MNRKIKSLKKMFAIAAVFSLILQLAFPLISYAEIAAYTKKEIKEAKFEKKEDNKAKEKSEAVKAEARSTKSQSIEEIKEEPKEDKIKKEIAESFEEIKQEIEEKKVEEKKEEIKKEEKVNKESEKEASEEEEKKEKAKEENKDDEEEKKEETVDQKDEKKAEAEDQAKDDENKDSEDKNSIWQENEDGSVTSKTPVQEGIKYEYKDSGFYLVFNKVETPGFITIKEFDPKDDLKASSKAYEVTSTMENGTFEYDLTIPYLDEKNDEELEVIYSSKEKEEDEYQKDDFQKVENDKELKKEKKKIKIKKLDHFTVFMVTDNEADYSKDFTEQTDRGFDDGTNPDTVHYNDFTEAGETVTWDLNVTTDGAYRVFVSWTTNPNRTQSAVYSLNYSGGSDDFVVNQEQLADQTTAGSPGDWSGWYELGEFDLDAASNVVLTTVDNISDTEHVIADEVMAVMIDAPINQGYNEASGGDENADPTDVACGGYTNENSIAENWSDIAGDDIIYQREVTWPNGTVSDNYFETNSHTNFVTFGGNPGTEGTWSTRVRAIEDINHDGSFGDKDVASSWSNACSITYDATAPVISFDDDVEAGPLEEDEVQISVVEDNLDSLEYGFSADAICDMSDSYDNNINSGDLITFKDNDHNGEYICVKAQDLAGNISYALSANHLNLIGIPEFQGWNLQSQSSAYDETPIDVTCVSGGTAYINEGGLAGNWEEVSGAKYIRANQRPDGSYILLDGSGVVSASASDLDDLTFIDNNVDGSYSDNNTGGWGNFGKGEGEYKTKIRAFFDDNGDGDYDAGEVISDWSEFCSITYDVTAPDYVTVDTLTTSDNTPELTGTVSEDDAEIEVTIEGVTYVATNDNDGTWTLADDTIAALADGVYDVAVTATDPASNSVSDATSDELTVDTTYPEMTNIKMFVNGVESDTAEEGDTIKITAEVTDNLVGVNRVQIWVRHYPWDGRQITSGEMTYVSGDIYEFEFTLPATYQDGTDLDETDLANYFNFRPWDNLDNSHINWRNNFTAVLADVTPPDAPIFYVEEDDEEILIAWQAVSDASTYNVYRSDDSFTNPIYSGSDLFYLDNVGLYAGFEYKVTAVDDSLNESDLAATEARYGKTLDIVIDDDAMDSDYSGQGTVSYDVWDWTAYNLSTHPDLMQNATGGDLHGTNGGSNGQEFSWITNDNLLGVYEVFVNYMCHNAPRPTVDYEVYSGSEMLGTVSVNQSEISGIACGSQFDSNTESRWISLGEFTFENDESAQVKLVAPVDPKNVIADAVGFKFIEALDVTPPDATVWDSSMAPYFVTRVGDDGSGNVVMKFIENPASDVDYYEYQFRACDLDGTNCSSGTRNMNNSFGGITCASGICEWTVPFSDGRINIHRFRAVDTSGNEGAWSNWNDVDESAFGSTLGENFQFEDYEDKTGIFGEASYIEANGGYAVREQVAPNSVINNSPLELSTTEADLDIEYSASDDDTTIKEVGLYVSFDGGVYSLVDSLSDEEGTFSYSFTDEGEYCFYTIAEDIADDLTSDSNTGNLSTPTDCELKVSYQEPVNTDTDTDTNQEEEERDDDPIDTVIIDETDNTVQPIIYHPILELNYGHYYTDDRDVHLDAYAPTGFNPTEVVFSNHSDFREGVWETYNPTTEGPCGQYKPCGLIHHEKAWHLRGDRDEKKTVYMKFRNSSGEETTVATNNIVLVDEDDDRAENDDDEDLDEEFRDGVDSGGSYSYSSSSSSSSASDSVGESYLGSNENSQSEQESDQNQDQEADNESGEDENQNEDEDEDQDQDEDEEKDKDKDDDKYSSIFSEDDEEGEDEQEEEVERSLVGSVIWPENTAGKVFSVLIMVGALGGIAYMLIRKKGGMDY
jgi:hypothetical protein